MAIPECKPIPRVPMPGEIVFPGGATLSAVLAAGSDIPSGLDAATNLLAQASPALAPVMPVFHIIDAVQGLVACIEAVPDALGPPPNPTKMIECLSELAPRIGKLANLVPQLAAPRLVVDVIDTFIDYLRGTRDQIEAIVLQRARSAEAYERANAIGDASLLHIAECAQERTTAQLQAMADALAPMDSIGTAVNMLLELLGLSALPPLAGLIDPQDADAALAALESVIDTLTGLRDNIPLP